MADAAVETLAGVAVVVAQFDEGLAVESVAAAYAGSGEEGGDVV